MDSEDKATKVTTGGGDDVDAKGVAPGQGGPTPPPNSISKIPVLKSSQFASDSYKMDYPDRGKALIINNKNFLPKTRMGERTGTDEDATNLYQMFTDMGFETVVRHDLPVDEMTSFLAKVAEEDHTHSDCFACAILSHGEEGYVYGKDGRVEIDKLVAPFKGDKCKSLAGKPKIFIIQACRGDKLDSGVTVSDALGKTQADAMEVDMEIRRIPTEADFLMAYSVVPGFYAWRNSSRGSWFIQALAEVVRANWERMDLLTMMTRVCKKVAYDFESNASKEFMNRKKQIPCITSMLTRDVYFTPKKHMK